MALFWNGGDYESAVLVITDDGVKTTKQVEDLLTEKRIERFKAIDLELRRPHSGRYPRRTFRCNDPPKPITNSEITVLLKFVSGIDDLRSRH
jgi:hypothetical protein